MSALEYLRLEKAVEQIRARWAAALAAVDLVLSPVIPVVSFPADQAGPAGVGASLGHLMFTVPYNLTGMPAGTVPVALSTRGLPIGVQLGGRRFDDGRVLGLLRLLESRREVRLPYPEIDPVEAVTG